MVQSQRGKQLILLNGYTYNQRSHFTWYCSTKPGCKANIKLAPDGFILKLNNCHCHERPLLNTRGWNIE